MKVLIFSYQSLSQILKLKISTGNTTFKVFINTTTKNINNSSKNIEYCNLKTINDCSDFILKNNINLIIVFSYLATFEGLVNFFKYNLKIPTIGITKHWSKLESSKLYAKEFMLEHEISTPLFMKIEKLYEINNIISAFGLPLVIKDDRLRAGFGTYICNTEKDCIKTVKKLLKENSFCIAEKYIKGEEVTLHHIWDGKTLISLEPVRDYKRLKENNEGINTGSMGCYLPVELASAKKEMINNYTKKLENVFQKIKPDFKGIFVSDLIMTNDKLYNLEFNMRPGIPEFEALIMHLETNIFDIFISIANSECDSLKIKYKKGTTGCVNIFHKDYSKVSLHNKLKTVNLNKNLLFNNKDNLNINYNIEKFNKKGNACILTNSPVLTIIKNSEYAPFPSIYKYIEKIKDNNLIFRKDIGQ